MIDNPGFELCEGWPEPARDVRDDGGKMMVRIMLCPEKGHDMVGGVPIYIDGYTTIGMSLSKSGEYRSWIHSYKRPWWAAGVLRRLWIRSRR